MQTPDQTPRNPRAIAEAPISTAPKTGFDVLKDEFKTQTHEDPIFRYIAESWRQILVGILVVVAILYARRAFIETQDQDARRSADVLSKVQAELEQYASATPDKKGEVSDRIRQAIASLGDTRAPYQELGPLYGAIVARESGDTNKALTSLPSTDPFTIDAGRNQASRLAAELSSLLNARILLDQQGKEGEGRTILKSLAEKGAFVRVAAALSLSLLANSPEEKAETLAILETIVREEPTQEPLLSGAIDRLRG